MALAWAKEQPGRPGPCGTSCARAQARVWLSLCSFRIVRVPSSAEVPCAAAVRLRRCSLVRLLRHSSRGVDAHKLLLWGEGVEEGVGHKAVV